MNQTGLQRFLAAAARIFRKLGGFLYKILCIIAGFIARVIKISRVLAIVCAIVIVVVIVVIVDGVSTAGKIYGGVHIGDVDVSNMTQEQAVEALREHYEPNLQDSDIVIFVDEDVADRADLGQRTVQYDAGSELISFDEAQESKLLWIENARTLGASIPYEELAASAFKVGRDEEGIIERISASWSGRDIPVTVDLNDEVLESIAADIDATLGTQHVDSTIVIDGGVATVVEGSDGIEVSRSWLADQIQHAVLSGGGGVDSIIVETSEAPMKIDAESAQETADSISTLVGGQVEFVYGDVTVDVDRATIGSWISTRIVDEGDGYRLDPYIDESKATSVLVSLINENFIGSQISVDITVDGDDITVTPLEEVTVPLIHNALAELDRDLFDGIRSDGEAEPRNLEITVLSQRVSDPMSFEDAYNYGVIEVISTFTTEFVNTSATANRAHNIQLAANLLNNSVAKAGGGRWSFNDIAGDCNEEAGFLSAGAIAGNEHVEEAGGGICQVATTVFNAVYEAGYEIEQRTNHSLYVDYYPVGRDAAIAYPYLDLVWRNDTASDVLLTTSYTDTSVTVTLYGVDPGYTVVTETSDWEEGAAYTTEIRVDDTLAPDARYIDTAGSNGMEITVYRQVYDKEGALIYDNVFESTYEPVNEVIVVGSAYEG